jgi:hypothetical protein
MWWNRPNVKRVQNRIVPAILFIFTCSFLTVISSPTANAITLVAATGTNPSICNQSGTDLGTTTGDVTASRLSGGDCLVQFLTVKSGYQWNRPVGVSSFKVMIVAGGGGGGAGGSHNGNCSLNAAGREGGGGGGGGGGQVIETSIAINSPSIVPISVGTGGTGGNQGACGAAGNNGGTGGTSSVLTVAATGGGGGGGGSTDGAGGLGGSTIDSLGNSLAGASRLSSGDCSTTTTTGCFAAGGGAGAKLAAPSISDAGTSTNGGNGGTGYTPTQVLVSGAFGGGGGGGDRHYLSAPTVSLRSGGSAGSSNGGIGNCCGDGSAANSNTGGGGGGGRGNGASNANTVNSGVGGTGGSGLVAIQYTPAFSATILKPTISGTLNKGISASVTVNVEAAGTVRFYYLGKRIPSCLNVATSGTYPTITATCSWKPAVVGPIPITAVLTPANSTLAQSQSQALTTIVSARQNTR